VLSFTSATGVFNVTYSGGAFSGSATLSASSASLTLGTAVTSTVKNITGTYALPAQTFSLTLGSMSFAISSFVNVTADGASVSYDPNTSTTVNLTDGTHTSSKAVSLLTIGVSNATIFAGVNGPSSNSNAMGVQVTGANLALALMSGSDGTTYYGLKATASAVGAVGLPSGFTLSATNLEVDVSGSTDGSNVVNFDSSFTPGTGLTIQTGAGSSQALDFTQKLVQASGSLELNFDGFVYISGSMSIQSGTTTTVTLSDSTTQQVSVLEIGASGVTIFAGVNGPDTNPGAVGVEVTGAGFGLALFKPTATANTTTYYGFSASATSISGVGLPSGVTASAGNLNVQINGATSGSAVVNFDSSFVAGTGLAIATGGAPINLDFTASLLQVAGSINLTFSSYISISGGFSFTQSGDTVSINLGASAYNGAPALNFSFGSGTTTYFSATGGLSMSFDASSITIVSATLTVDNGFTIPSILQVTTPTVALSNISIDKATGQISGAVVNGTPSDPDLTIKAGSATLFPGNSTISASITPTNPGDNGLQGVFNLQTGAFSITLQQFTMTVGSVFTAQASDVVISYDPTNTDPNQQLVSIGSGTITFNQFQGGISGNVTNLIIFADGFQFGSLTVGYTGTINLGSVLTLTGPSVTLTNFAVTFGNGNASFTETGSLTVSVTSASLSLGSISSTVSGLSISISLDPTDFGHVTVAADTVTFQFSSVVSFDASNVAINTAPANGDAYLSVGSATVTLTLGSISLGGTVTNFSFINSNGTVAFDEDTGFSVSINADAGTLHLPSWLGIQISQFSLTWPNFATDPTNFQLTLSASITGIHGLPAGVTVSGFINDAVIDVGRLERGEFPITSIGGFGGSVSGTIFGLQVNASFILGIVNLNAAGQIVNSDGTVTDPSTGNPVAGGSTTVTASVMYVGVSGGAQIPGVGGVEIYLGFSQLGPLTVYLSAQFPIILDPDSGLAISGFSGGVLFDYTLPTPTQPTDLRTIPITEQNISITQWQQQLQFQTVLQYNSSGGGTNLSAAYAQPMVIEAGVSLDDAYLSANAFQITGNIAICFDPSNPTTTKIYLEGIATFGDSISFKAYLYANIDASGPTPTIKLMFLMDEPGDTPIESFGGTLLFGFTDSLGNPITPTVTVTTSTQTTATGSTYLATTYSQPTQAGGFYVSLTGFLEYSALGYANVTINGAITLTVTATQAKIDLWGNLNVSFLGDIAVAQGEFVINYATSSPQFYGALKVETGAAFNALQPYGLTADGAILFQINTTGVSQTVNLPNAPPTGGPPAGLVGPLNSSNSTPFTIIGPIIFDLTIFGTTPSTFATLSYSVGSTTLFSIQGFLDIRLTNDPSLGLGLQMFVNINQLQIGPPSTAFLTFSGFGLIVINSQGLAAELSVNLSASDNNMGLSLTAGFNLVLNTTSQDVTYNIPTFPVPSDQSGNSAPAPPVTIYNSSGTATGTATSLVIPAGLPQGELSVNSNGQAIFVNVGATGPYLSIAASGTLQVVGLTFTGDFQFQISSTASGIVVSMVLDMTGSLPAPISGSATVIGAFQLDDSGVEAYLSIGGNTSSTTPYGPGIALTGNFQLALNTTGSSVPEIGGVTLPSPIGAHTFVIEGTGTLTLYLTPGTGFVITGTIASSTTTINGNTESILNVTGNLTATVNQSTLLSVAVNGALLIIPNQGGVAGELTVTLNAGNPLDGSGFNFNGSFVFEINATNAQQTVPALPGGGSTPITINPGPFSMVVASGTLSLGTATNGFNLMGSFYLAIGAHGLAISTAVSFDAVVGGVTIMTLNASGAMEITANGLAASFKLSVASGSPFSMANAFSFSGNFTFQINTTGQGINDVIGTTTLNLLPGPYVQVSVAQASLALGSTANAGLALNGGFTLTISSSGMAVSAQATLVLAVGGTTFFSLSATGALLITQNGIAAYLSLGAGSQPGDSNFSFNVSFLLEINSTNLPITTINNQTVNLPPGPYFEIVASGSLTLGGVININGSFTFTINNGSAQITIDASLNVFNITFTVSGNAGLYSDGVALSITLMLGSSNKPTVTLIPGVLSVTGALDLEVNTTGTIHFGVAANTLFDVNVPSVTVNIFGFPLTSASLDIGESGGVFSATGHLSFDFFHFATFNVDFYFDSHNNYWFYGYTYVQLGSDDFNIHGNLTVEFASNSELHVIDPYNGVSIDHNFLLHVQGGVTAFDFTFASIGADVTINGSDVSISVYVSVNFGLFSIGGTVTIDLGSINPPPAPPPPPALGTVNGGVLTLNFGPHAVNRGVPALANEAYTIELVPGTSPGATEDLWIIAPGVYSGPAAFPDGSPIGGSPPVGAVEYDGVTSIVANTGTSNTTLSLAGVNVPLVITAGSGANHFVLSGGTSTITGTSGNDTVIGGSGNVTFNAGSGHSLFIGGPANQNTINNSTGNLTVIEGYQWTDHTVTPAVEHDIYYQSYDLNGPALTYSNGGPNYSDVINGPATITLSTPGSGTATFSVENFPGSQFVLTLNGNGNPSATASISNNGDLALNGDLVGINGTTISLESISNLTLVGGSTGDHLSVTNSSDIAIVTLQGNAGSDSFTVNFLGNESYTVNVTGTGSGNALTINGTNSDNTYRIIGSPVTLASETVNYSDMQRLVLNAFNGNDTIDIGHTATTTIVNGGNGNDTYNLQANSQPVTLNLGSGTNLVNVGSLAPTESGGLLSGVQALVTVNGGHGGLDTLYLDNSGSNVAQTATVTTTSITGMFGQGGSLVYEGIAALNLFLSNAGVGNPGNTLDIQGMNGTVNANLGNGDNTVNLGSTAGLVGPGSLSPLKGVLNLTGGGNDALNADDSGSYNPENVILTASTLSFSDPLFITFTGFSAMNINLSRSADIFAVTDTFASASLAPVISIYGEAGNDVFDVFNTHATMAIHGGSGNVSMYVFQNSAPLYLYGDTGRAAIYLFAQVSGGSYVTDAQVTITGGTGGDNSLSIFGTPLNDVFLLDGTPTFTGLGLKVAFSNIQGWLLVGLGGNNVFYVEGTFIPTTLIGDGGSLPVLTVPPGLPTGLPPALPVGTAGNNTFYLGWQGANYIPGSLAGIDAPLTISSQGGTATAYVDDSSETADENYTLTPTTLTSTSMGPAGVIIYDSTIDNLNITCGAGNDTITVNGDGAGVQTTIDGGPGNDAFIVNGTPLTTPLAILGGTNTFGGNTLTVNGSGIGNNYVVTGFTIDGAGATISYEEIQKLTINSVGGNSTFTVNGDSIPTYLNGGNDGDTFVVNSSSAPLFLVGGTGSDSFTINGNGGPLTASSANGDDSFTVNGNGGSIVLTGGAEADSFVINGNSGELLTATGGDGNNSFIVNSNSSPATLIGGSGDNTFTVNCPLAAALTIEGGGSGDVLTVNGTVGNDFWTITNSFVGGVGAPIDFAGITSLFVNGIAGNDTFNVLSTGPATTINTGSGSSTINVGSTAPVLGGKVNGIQGALTIVGSGHDTLNIDDSGDSATETGTLTSTTLTGLGLGESGITFSGLVALNLSLGSGSETLFVVNTPSATTTINGGAGTDIFNVQAATGVINLNGGAGIDTFNLGSGGTVSYIVSQVNINGGTGTSTVNVYDNAVSGALTGLLTATNLTGLGFGVGVAYTHVTYLNLNLGSGNDTFNVEQTAAGTTTTVNTGGGSNTVNVGSLAPASGGLTHGIQGPVVVVGSGKDTLNVDDSGSSVNETGNLTPTLLAGLGMGASGITYSGLAALNVTLGSGNDSFAINDITSSTVTTVNGGGGSNSATLNFSHDFSAQNLTLLNFGTSTLNVAGNFTGLLNDAGAISTTNIAGSFTSGGVLNVGSLGSLSIGGDLAGLVNDAGALGTATIGGSLGSTGVLNATSMNSLTIGKDLAGQVNDSGALPNVSIGGSLTATGILNAASISTMVVGLDLAGLLNVKGLLNTLAVTGGTPGEVIAGSINVITVQAGYGNKVFQVIEGGIQRQIDATPVSGGSMPADIHFSFVYDDSVASGNPSVAIRVVNGGPVVEHSFNLALVSLASKSKFNLALLSASGQSGISNVSVDGDILVGITAAEGKFFGLNAGSRGGVLLPSDQITGVEVSGRLPIGMINVAGIEAVAFAVLTTIQGKLVNILGDLGSKGHPQVLWNLLGSKATIRVATDALVIPFNETHSVKVYAQVASSNPSLQYATTLTDTKNDNLPIKAYVQIKPALTHNAVPSIASIALVGSGGSIDSRYSVGTITSTGPLGSVTVRAKPGIGSITAPSILGKIVVPKGAGKVVIHLDPSV